MESEKPIPRKISKGKVYILSFNFYDWAGKTIYKGGAERYIYDLAVLLKQLGYHPVILQGAKGEPFEKTYHGVKIRGVPLKKPESRYVSGEYNTIVQDAEFVIASPVDLACEIYDVPVIGINHGIAFDGPNSKAFAESPTGYKIYTDAVEHCTTCVCVDTNFINWMRTRNYKLGNKLIFVPNYYDKTAFHPTKHTNNKNLTCVYPRRLYSARGYDITIKAFRKLFKKYPTLHLNFVGQVDNDKVKKDLEKFQQDFPKNISHLEYSMKDMPKAYEPADIVLVPTRYAEGTSLSCIEGLASGAAVVATNIGGLPNLIIDHYNGLLISPTPDAIEAAISELIDHPDLRKKLSKNGQIVAENAFEKTIWEKRWTSILKSLATSAK